MTMTATARPVNGTLRHEVDVNGRHTIFTDEPERLGGTDTGPAPHELMAAMVASCVSTTISMYAQARAWNVEGLSVDVTYDSATKPRHIDVTVHLPAGLREGQIKRLRRVAETCPATRSLEAGCAFDEQLVFDAGVKECAVGS